VNAEARVAAYAANIDAEYASLARSGKAEDQLCLALMQVTESLGALQSRQVRVPAKAVRRMVARIDKSLEDLSENDFTRIGRRLLKQTARLEGSVKAVDGMGIALPDLTGPHDIWDSLADGSVLNSIAVSKGWTDASPAAPIDKVQLFLDGAKEHCGKIVFPAAADVIDLRTPSALIDVLAVL